MIVLIHEWHSLWFARAFYIIIIMLLFLMKLAFFVICHYFLWCLDLNFHYWPWSTKSNCILITLCLFNIFAGWCNNHISNKRIGQTDWWSLAKVYWRSLTFKVSKFGYKYGKEWFKAAVIIMQLMIIMLKALLRCHRGTFFFIDTLTRQQLLIGGGDPLEDIQKFKSEG